MQFQAWLTAAYKAFEAAFEASFVGRIILGFGGVVFVVLIQTLDLNPLDMTFTGEILIDFPVALALSCAVGVAFGFALFGLYIGSRSLLRALLLSRRD